MHIPSLLSLLGAGLLFVPSIVASPYPPVYSFSSKVKSSTCKRPSPSETTIAIAFTSAPNDPAPAPTEMISLSTSFDTAKTVWLSTSVNTAKTVSISTSFGIPTTVAVSTSFANATATATATSSSPIPTIANTTLPIVNLTQSANITIGIPAFTTVSNQTYLLAPNTTVVGPANFTVVLNATEVPKDDVERYFDWTIQEKALTGGSGSHVDVFSLHCGIQVNPLRNLTGQITIDYNLSPITPPYITADNGDGAFSLVCDPAKCLIDNCEKYTAPVVDSNNANLV
ncbi:hypothetical protein IAR55_003246 [Kwoniella newhampshirensis]|uniref:Uncharacterized protein n=1 Tax=Kwoniella newhampshirensis TaxID=1651941 RepID=A0AAW0YLX4_9TREE